MDDEKVELFFMTHRVRRTDLFGSRYVSTFPGHLLSTDEKHVRHQGVETRDGCCPFVVRLVVLVQHVVQVLYNTL